MMKSGLFQRKLTKFTIKTSTASAPVVSALNSPFSNNSRASAAALSELTQCLDLMFDQVNYKDEPGDLLQLHLSRLAEQAAKYSNASLEESHGSEWTCSTQVWQLVHVACECANLVYKPLEHQDSDLVRVLETTPSFTGTKKAFSMWKMETLGALVVSVRGTACVADHMVNLNAQPAEASSTLGLPAGVLAHEGFLTCAKAIKTPVLQELAAQAKLDKTISNIIFTGHSAGGAVSSLLFLNLAFNLPVQMSHISLSLVTFGSAPVTSANISSLVKKLPSIGSVLAFVNEYDMVPRADTAYVRSLIELYRARYGTSSSTDSISLDGYGQATKETACTDTHTCEKGDTPLPTWPLPEPLLYPVGDIIISKRDILQHGATADTASDPTARPTRTYKMFHVPRDTFDKLLFCGLGAHKRKVYLERTRSMVDHDSWSDTATLRTVESQYSNTTR